MSVMIDATNQIITAIRDAEFEGYQQDKDTCLLCGTATAVAPLVSVVCFENLNFEPDCKEGGQRLASWSIRLELGFNDLAILDEGLRRAFSGFRGREFTPTDAGARPVSWQISDLSAQQRYTPGQAGTGTTAELRITVTIKH